MLTLTRREALDFADTRLGIKETEKRLTGDRCELLNDLVVAFHNNIPFQTLTNLAVNADSRRIPTVIEMKSDVLTGIGGMCIVMNGFFQALLSALGYDCYLTEAKMWDEDIVTHVLTIVQNLLRTGDAYLVEVGVAYPTLRAIALDFELESPAVVELVWWGKVVRVQPDAGEVQRCPVFLRRRKQIDPEVVAQLGFGRREISDQWTNLYRFKLEPQSYAELCGVIDTNVYRIPSHKLNRTLILIWWRKNRAIVLRDNNLTKEIGDGVCQSVKLETDEDIASTIVREFPIFDRDFVEKVLKLWRVGRQATST